MKKNTTTARAYTGQINAAAGDGRNHTGLKLATMTGKLQCLIIGTDENGDLCFIRSGGKHTIVRDYSPTEVLEVMRLTGKAVGDRIRMRSLSTSMLLNENCIKRFELQDPDCICSYCFSAAALSAQDKRGAGMRRNLKHNTGILTGGFLNWKDIPVIQDDFFRFESHGDLISAVQLINYVMICEKAAAAGSKCRFALWTKNPWILETVFIQYGIRKPANLQIQLSSAYMNRICDIPETLTGIIDRVFTVWTSKEAAAAAGVVLNCCNGIRKHTYCIGCTNCYIVNNGVVFVNELLRVK